MPLRAYALAIDRNLVHGAEPPNAELGPALSFGRAYAEPVEKRGDAVVRQYACEFMDQSHGLDIGLTAILTSTVFGHFKPRMIAALLIQYEVQLIFLERDDDLFQDGP